MSLDLGLKKASASLFGYAEEVRPIEIAELKPFPGHPFEVKMDDKMTRLVEKIKKNGGVLEPVIVWQGDDNNLYLVAGHRRTTACKLAGFSTVDALVRRMDRSTAFEQMRDSNLERRTEFLPGELAKVYAQTVEDLGRQRGRRSDLELGEEKYDAAQRAADELGISKTNLNRYVRLTYLIPELLSMVNEKRIKFQPAVELSFLNENRQRELLCELQANSKLKISLDMAKELRTNAEADYSFKINEESIENAEADIENRKQGKKLDKSLDLVNLTLQKKQFNKMLSAFDGQYPTNCITTEEKADFICKMAELGIQAMRNRQKTRD